MAIALNDNFIACAGFADHTTLRKNFEDNRVLMQLIPVLIKGEFNKQIFEDPTFL